MVVTCTYTCQTDRQMLLGMMNACPILCCDSPSSHWWWTCTVQYLILAECHLTLDPYVLVQLMSGWVVLDPNITAPYHLLWVPTQSYHTILLFYLLPVVLWCPILVVAEAPPWTVSVMHMLCAWGAWNGLLTGLSCKENVPLKHPISLNTSPYVSCILCVMVALLLLSASVLFEE